MNRIKYLREEKNMSQSELAKILGVTQQALSNYEKGLREPDIESLNKLAEYFNVSIDYLLGRSSTRNADVIEEAIKGDPELERIWSMLNNREDIRLMFKKIADLKPEDIKTLILIKKVRMSSRELFKHM